MSDLYKKFSDLTTLILEKATSSNNPNELISVCLKEIGVSLKADRCYIFEEKDNKLSNTYEWHREDLKSTIDLLQNISVSYAKYWYKEFETNQSVIIENVDNLKESRYELYEALKKFNIKTLIVGPLILRGKIVGFYGVNNLPIESLENTSKILSMLILFAASAIQRRELEIISSTDYLTGLYNRRKLYNDIKTINAKNGIGIIYCDVASLKQTNDEYGHEKGDELILLVTKCLKLIFNSDCIYRIGGDEFLVICLGIDEEELEDKAHMLDHLIKENNMKINIGTSWCLKIDGPQFVNDLITQAEKHMYIAKRYYYNSIKESISFDEVHNNGYSICLYTKEIKQKLTNNSKKHIHDLLKENGGVGIMSGYFDDKLTIRYVSDLALSALGYPNYYDFYSRNYDSMYNLVKKDEIDKFIKNIRFDSNTIWHLKMRSYNGKEFNFKVLNRLSDNIEGEMIWIISIRLAEDKEDIYFNNYLEDIKKDTILIFSENNNSCYNFEELFKNEYKVIKFNNRKKALDYVYENINKLACVILDFEQIEKFDKDALNRLNIDKITTKLPIISIIEEINETNEKIFFEAGVYDVIRKPYSSSLFKMRVLNTISLFNHKNKLENLIEERTNSLKKALDNEQHLSAILKKENESIIDMLGTIVEYRDVESGEHIKRVKKYTQLLGNSYIKLYPNANLSKDNVNMIVAASPLHDIGKIAIADSILLKPGKLTPEELKEMKTHTVKGANLLKQLGGIWHLEDPEYYNIVYDTILYHHERWDGKGYPYGLKCDEIPLSAQIVSIADVYDALVNDRCYKEKYSKEDAFNMIINGECGAFSPKIINALINIREQFENIDIKEEIIQTNHRLKMKADIQARVNNFANIGLWSIEIIHNEKPKFYIDENMEKLLGIDSNLSPEETFEKWYDLILPEEVSKVDNYLNDIIINNKATIRYLWNHPSEGIIKVHCGGLKDETFLDGVRLNGYHRHFYNYTD